VTATPVATIKTIIVADDTAFVRDRFATALLGAGHTALTVKSAAELLARVRSDCDRIDLIVLDLRLPHAGGVDLVRSIRKLDEGRLPILVFSGTISTADEVRELAALGVSGYVNEYSAVQHILPSLAPHLFPANFNRRGSPRVVLGIPVAYRFGNTIAAALTLNLSKGGLAIRTMSPLQGGAKVRVHDPEALENVRQMYGDKLSYFEQPYGALEGAEALAIMTEWKQFLQPDFSVMRRLMRSPVIFDGRNLYDPDELRRRGLEYYPIGRPAVRAGN